MTYRQHDPGDECDRCHDQLALPVTAPERCRKCGAVEPRHCEFDAMVEYGLDKPRFRPRDCIAGGQLAPDQPLPY